MRNWRGMLMQPFSPGRSVSEDNWRLAFGKTGKYDDETIEETPMGGYNDRLTQALKKQAGEAVDRD